MTEQQIKQCIKDNNVHAFYTCRQWTRLRDEVLADDKHECQECKRKGKYTKATHVHHVNYLKHRPDLALSKLDENNKRNLISLCHDCHEEKHGHRQEQKVLLNEERW